MNQTQKLAQSMFRQAATFSALGQDNNATAIYSALHAALDEIGVPRGDQRKEYLGA